MFLLFKKLEENEEKFSKNIERLSNLEEENKSIQCTLNKTGRKLLEANDSKEELLKELDKIKSEKEKEELSDTNTDGVDQLTSDLKDCRSLVNEKEQKISELEKEVMHLYSKLKEHCGVEGQRRSAVLKEHCVDLENRLEELEAQNNILKEKLKPGFTSFEEQRKSTAEELSDVLKEHCEDLENRFKEVEAENNELKTKLITNSSTNDEDVDTCLREQIISLQNENDSLKSHSVRLEEKIVVLTDKLTIDNNSEMNRRSTADELSDVLKEHCTDLEVRLREQECENEELKQTISRYTSHLPENERAEINILETEKKELRIELAYLKEKNSLDQEKIKSLQRDIVSCGEKLRADSVSESNRRSVEVELTDVYKEHCQDLETRMEELQLENSELSAKIDQLKAANEKLKMQQKELEAKIKMLESGNLELQNGMLSSTHTGSLAEEFPSVFIDNQNDINQISTNDSRVHDLEVELENLRCGLVDKSEYILANEESKNKELLLDDELQRLRLQLSEKHKEESDELHVKIHQLEYEVLKLNSLVNENSETMSDNQNMNEEIRELDSNRDDLTDVCRQEDSDKYLQLQHSLEILQQEHEQCVEMRADLEKLQRESDQKISIESQTDENVFVQKLDISKSEDNVQEDSKFTQLQSQITQLKIENQSLHNALRDAQNINLMKHEVCLDDEHVSSSPNGFTQKCEDIEMRYEESTEKSGQLNNEMTKDVTKQHCINLMSKIDELQTQNSDLKKQFKTESEPLKSQMADMSIQVDESLETHIQMGNIECDIEKLQEEKTNSAIEELQCKVNLLIKENKSLTEKLEADNSNKLYEVECKIESENKCLLETVGSTDTSKVHELECKIEALENENKSLLDKIGAIDVTKLKELECKVAVLEEENRCLSKETKENSISTIQELECKIEILEDENKHILEKLENFDSMKFQELECKIEVLVEENKSLLEKLDDKDMSKVQELECQIQFLKEENKYLVEKLESKDAGMKTVQELEFKIKVLEEENMSFQEKLEGSDKFQQMQCQVEILDEENKCLLEENTGNLSKIQELECQVEVLEEESKRLLEKTEEKDALAEKLVNYNYQGPIISECRNIEAHESARLFENYFI